MRWMNRLATTLTVAVIVAGPPMAAALWWLHHPWRPPTRSQLSAWLERPLTAGTIIAGCLAAAVAIWLLMLWYLARRALTAAARRWRRLRNLPVPTPAQMTAGSMAGVAALTLPTAPVTVDVAPSSPVDAPQLLHLADDQAEHADPAGIELPGGGWIPDRTAALITTVAALVWLNRRRNYRPREADPGHRDDDLQPLPPIVQAITAATAEQPGDSTTGSLLNELPIGVLALTGPGAPAAARGLLVTAALATATSTSISVHVRPEELRYLLPDHATPTWLESWTAETAANAGTVITLADTGAACSTWHVTAAGVATGTHLNQPQRLCMLDPQPALDLLTLATGRETGNPEDPVDLSAAATAPIPPVSEKTPGWLTLLGDCQLTINREPVALRRTASLQVLAYLAIHPLGGTRSELTAAIWPHLAPATISQRLHTTLTDLRQQLRPILSAEPLTRNDDRYRLNTTVIGTDLTTWRDTAHTAASAVNAPQRQAACRRLVDLYLGELAEGRTWPWLAAPREALRRDVIDACTVLAEHATPAEALVWLQRAIDLDPYNEAVHKRAAKVLKSAGDSAARPL